MAVSADIDNIVEQIFECNSYEANRLIADCDDVNIKDSDGNTLLYHAVSSKDLDVVKLLIEKGADVDTKSKNGNTLLEEVVIMYHDSSFSIHVDRADDHIMKLFRVAGAMMELLINSGSNVDIRCNGRPRLTPLYAAAFSGNFSLTKLIIGKLNTRIDNGELNEILCHVCGVPVDDRREDCKIAELLIKNGDDVNYISNRFMCYPLRNAVINLNPDMMRLLIKNGADARKIDDNRGESLLCIAAHTYSSESPSLLNHFRDVVNILLENGANITLKNNKGKTPIDINHDPFQQHLPELYAIYNIVAEHRTQQVTKEDGTVESVVNFKENDGKIISQFYNQYRDISVGVINAKYRDFIIEKINSPPSLQYLAANTSNKATVGDNSKISELPLPESIKDNIRNPKKVIMNGDFYAFEERGIISPREELAAAASTSAATNRPSTSAETNVTDPSEENAARSSTARRG